MKLNWSEGLALVVSDICFLLAGIDAVGLRVEGLGWLMPVIVFAGVGLLLQAFIVDSMNKRR